MLGLRKKTKRPATRRLCGQWLEPRAMLHGASVSGFVYLDADGDGTRDDAELGVPGVVIRLGEVNATDEADERSTITDINGAYRFEELLAGTYQIIKRQSPGTIDTTSASDSSGTANSGDDVLNDLVLGDEEARSENNFAETGLRPDLISIAWFFASTPPAPEMLRETIAVSEEMAGNDELADSIRAGSDEVPDESNVAPVAVNDSYSTLQNQPLNVNASNGVLANDTDADGDTLTATVVTQPANGTLTLNADGSFTYTPNTDFVGTDTFTYRAADAETTSGIGTVTLTVTADDDDDDDDDDDGTQNEPFGPITPGNFDDEGLLGTRTDLLPGAPPITAPHITTVGDYTGYSNPPTYGPHHGVVRDEQNNFITPRPSGVYTTEQPDEDLIHNLEHGHVWISYNPDMLSETDRDALAQLVEDGGTDTGVIMTPRARNTSAIVLASWARMQTLDAFDATAVRNFIETNRGHAPEGFIPSGQKGTTAESENLDDDLPHAPAT